MTEEIQHRIVVITFITYGILDEQFMFPIYNLLASIKIKKITVAA
jgi:hypothetical protein